MKRMLLPVLALAVAVPAFASSWNAANNPNMITRVTGKPLVTSLNALPLDAKLANPHFIWSETYWPSEWGGIAYRWNSEPNPRNFKYHMYSKAELSRMTLVDLEKLSPAEKYDIFMARYDYPLTRRVLRENSPRAAWWEGICHGWSPAAVNHIEPARVDLPNADGILVPFGASDVKGLLSFYYAKVHKTDERFQVGRRCKVPGKVPGEATNRDPVRVSPGILGNTPDCADMNAGAFHLAITNMIGLNNMGFVVEVDRYKDVWNQPLGQYESKIVGERNTWNGGRMVRMKTTITYGEELNTLDPAHREREGGFMSMDPVTGTDQQTFTSKHYEYSVELNSRGEITGGVWHTETRPDFIWTKGAAKTFVDDNYGLAGLNQIYVPVAL